MRGQRDKTGKNVMITKIFILKVSNQNEDGSYDYVKMAGALS